jgi:hypothetical protein
MHSVQRHRTAILVVLMALLTWCSLFVVYDYRSPVNQMLSGMGTVPLEGWTAHELDAACIRLEPPTRAPVLTADKVAAPAASIYPKAYVREVVLVTFRNPCTHAGPGLAWAVSLTWPPPTNLTQAAIAARPPQRAVVIVDAISGGLVMSYAQGKP